MFKFIRSMFIKESIQSVLEPSPLRTRSAERKRKSDYPRSHESDTMLDTAITVAIVDSLLDSSHSCASESGSSEGDYSGDGGDFGGGGDSSDW